MSVYIPGMEMPRHCRECCFEAEGYFCWVVEATRQDTDEWLCTQFYGDTQTRPDFCPLVSVPDHGRLIDADAAVRAGWTISRTYSASPTETVYEVKRVDFLPTIIPADKEGEE